jgi:hypothetical protein
MTFLLGNCSLSRLQQKFLPFGNTSALPFYYEAKGCRDIRQKPVLAESYLAHFNFLLTQYSST